MTRTATLRGRLQYRGPETLLRLTLVGRRLRSPKVQITIARPEESLVTEWKANAFDSLTALRKLARTALSVQQWRSARLEIHGIEGLDWLPVSIDYAIDCGSFSFRPERTLPYLLFRLTNYQESGLAEILILYTEADAVEAFGRSLDEALRDWGDWDEPQPKSAARGS
jgi:hypothetical protein